MDKTKELFLKCSCSSEGLQVVVDKEYGDYYVSFWQQGHGIKLPFLFRLKYAWKLLTKGLPYGDDVILTKKDVNKLIKFLQNNV